MKVWFVTLILLLNYKLLYITPWVHIQGRFNMADIGIVLTFCYIFYIFIKKGSGFFANKFSIWILVLTLLVSLHIPIAMIKYHIHMSDGIIASRKFLLYFNFFIFLDLFEDESNIHKFFKILMFISIISIVLGIINYAGIKVLFNDRWTSEDFVVMRGGVERGYFPAYWVIVMTSIYSFTQYMYSDKYKLIHFCFIVVTSVCILLRQTRMIIGSYGIVVLANMFKNPVRSRTVLLIVIGFFLSIVLMSNYQVSSVMIKLYDKTEEEVSETSGTWGARVDQFETALTLFVDNPLIGSGASALRTNIEAYKYMNHYDAVRLVNYGYSADLGYATWLKNFGLIGVFMIIYLFVSLFCLNKKNKICGADKAITHFVNSYLFFLIISFVTINTLGHTEGIMLVTILMGLTQAMRNNLTRQEAKMCLNKNND